MTIDEWNDKKATTVEKVRPEDTVVEEPAKFKNDVVEEAAGATEVTKVTGEASSAAKLGLALGVISIVLGVFFAGAPWLGIVVGTIAIIIGATEKNKGEESKGIATGALTCGIVGVSLSVAFGILFGILGIAIKILTKLFGWIF